MIVNFYSDTRDTAAVASNICLQNKTREKLVPWRTTSSLCFHGQSALGKFTVYFKVNYWGTKENGPINNNPIPNITNFIH